MGFTPTIDMMGFGGNRLIRAAMHRASLNILSMVVFPCSATKPASHPVCLDRRISRLFMRVRPGEGTNGEGRVHVVGRQQATIGQRNMCHRPPVKKVA